LTGLGNRTLLMDTLEKQIRDYPDQRFSLLLLDLDNFRILNDTAGHVVGDTILIELSRRIKYAVPSRDQLFRLEGDEFAILHKEGASGQAAYQFSHRIREALGQPVDMGDRTFQTTASIGISHYPDHGQTPLMLFRSADSAVMHAKSQGKDREEEFDSGQDLEHRIRLDLASRLDQAIRKKELELYFQPIVNLRDGRALGAEALLRWHEPELGFVAPDVFIPIAEETGQIRVLGDLVLETAALTLEKWNRIVPDFSISVNISPGQLSKSNLLSSIRALLSRHRLSPRNLKLEITENLLLEDKNISLLRQVRDMGIRLVMDDFGTGYSSFAYLQKFLFDILKIDKSFLLHLHDEPSNPHLVEAMVRMAHSLQMEVVAEGIETEEISGFLKTLGCEMGQGYLYAPALTSGDFEQKFLRNGTRPLSPSVV
ncbi:MAG: bifunctional diguanylate cyclase/phosphodiesterase, partial [Leptospiraceae bacterium]|nr:bifunctional diguanylate cyclase/phosphodiesterase [Leptospiraceae bacterium]